MIQEEWVIVRPRSVSYYRKTEYLQIFIDGYESPFHARRDWITYDGKNWSLHPMAAALIWKRKEEIDHIIYIKKQKEINTDDF